MRERREISQVLEENQRKDFETNEDYRKLRVFVLVRERWKLECPRVIKE